MEATRLTLNTMVKVFKEKQQQRKVDKTFKTIIRSLWCFGKEPNTALTSDFPLNNKAFCSFILCCLHVMSTEFIVVQLCFTRCLRCLVAALNSL